MINISEYLRTQLNKDNRNYRISLDITLKNGTKLSIDNTKLWQGGFTLVDETSNTGTFDIGAVIAKKLTLVINNIYGDYTEYDFTDAVISNVKVSLNEERILQSVLQDVDSNYILDTEGQQIISYIKGEYSEGIYKGVYNVVEPSYDGSLITLECYDNMYKFDLPYSNSKLKYPATLLAIVRDACSCCGVQLSGTASSFDMSSFSVASKPDSVGTTFRQVLNWVGEIACKYFKCDINGLLTMGWYNFDKISELQNYEKAGTLNQKSGYHSISSYSSASFATDDVVITGIKVIEEIDGDNNKVENETMQGSKGYVLTIDGNKLIQGGNGTRVASFLATKLIGRTFRPLQLECLSDFSMETGDIIYVTDIKGNHYWSVINRTTFTIGEYQSVSCEAESPARNSAKRASEATQVYKALRKQLSYQKSEWEKAAEQLEESIKNAGGLFPIVEQQDDGTSKFYFCDHKTKEESSVIIELNSAGWSMSTDGGKTINGGMSVDGTMIAQILNTHGINADWINSGAFEVRDQNTNEITFRADTKTGNVTINANSMNIQGQDLNDYVQDSMDFSNSTNLIRDWKFTTLAEDSDTKMWDVAGTVTGGYDDPFGGKRAIRLVTNASITDGFISANRTNNAVIYIPGRYEVSVWLKSNITRTIKVSFNRSFKDVQLTSTWKKFSWIVDVADGEIGEGQLFTIGGYGGIGANNIVYAYQPKAQLYMSAEEAFNVLTNNGEIKGMFMRNGNIYFNADYILTGKLTIGGKNSELQRFLVLDVGGRMIADITPSGFKYLRYFEDTPKYDSKGKMISVPTVQTNGTSGTAQIGIQFHNSVSQSDEFNLLGGAFTVNKSGLQVKGIPTKLYAPASSAVSPIGVTVSSETLSDGQYYGEVKTVASSSIRYKEITRELTQEDIEKFFAMPIYMAHYKEDYLDESDERYMVDYPMFIAEEIEKIMPTVVDHRNGVPETWNERAMIPVMFQMIKELKTELEETQKQLSELKKGGK